MNQPTRVAIVTGASSGIGLETARALVAQGWRVIGTGRAPARIAAARQDIAAAAAQGGSIEMLTADLSLIAQAHALADAIAARTDRVDLLVNNAGGMTDHLEITAEGLEANFVGNHLGPFALTLRLLPLLEAAAASSPPGAVRVLMTASDASEMVPGIDPDDMQNLARWDPGLAYCTGKLANVLFARALAARLTGSGIVAHAMAPGATASNFQASAPQATRERMQAMPMRTVRRRGYADLARHGSGAGNVQRRLLGKPRAARPPCPGERPRAGGPVLGCERGAGQVRYAMTLRCRQ
ncbi:MAG: SDR family NAD(P)-dependent oxidoreductase [Novosphingobium sp.]